MDTKKKIGKSRFDRGVFVSLSLEAWKDDVFWETKKNLTSISYINWRYCKCSTIKYVVAELFLLLLIELFAYTLLPHFSLHSNISTIITFSSAWIIYKQFWRSCGIFGSNQSFIITFHPPSVSRSSSTSLIFHSAPRPFPSTFVEYSPRQGISSIYLLK